MKPLGEATQIFCPSDAPSGLLLAEITTHIVQAVIVPPAKLDEAMCHCTRGMRHSRALAQM
jgi:hypothetical protein